MSPARPKLRVVIVDDHTLFREGLRTILETRRASRAPHLVGRR